VIPWSGGSGVIPPENVLSSSLPLVSFSTFLEIKLVSSNGFHRE